jgi:hypothetical protein
VSYLIPAIDDENEAILRGPGVDAEPSSDLLPKLFAAKETDSVCDLVGVLKAEPAMLPPYFVFQPLSITWRCNYQEHAIHRYREPAERIRSRPGLLKDLDHSNPSEFVDESVEGAHGGDNRSA